MLKKISKIYSLIIVVTFLYLAISSVAFANTGIMDNLNSVAGKGYDTSKPYTESTVRGLAGSIVQIALGFIGVIFLILVIVSGIQWMTSGGNTDKINKARQRLINSVIGLGIVLLGWVIVYTVLSYLNSVN